MPIEGIPEPATPPATPELPATPTTPDAGATSTGQAQPGTGTQPDKPEAQPEEKKFTQADLDRHLQTRLPKAVKAELKRLSSDDPDKPSVDDLQRQLSETKQRAQIVEARESVRDYLSDPVHKLNVRSENIPAIVKLVIPDLEYDDDGKPTNLKEAITTASKLAPALFANVTPSINAANGRNTPITTDMNARIRQAAGFGT